MFEQGGNAVKARPVTSAFLLCDRIITEEGTHKKALIGIFTTMLVSEFPMNHGPVWLYYKGTMEVGEHEFHVDYARRGADELLGEVKGLLVVKDGKVPTELAAELPFITIPSEGVYEFKLWIDGAYVQRATFSATLRKKAGEPSAHRGS
jgi:hypothetical protein